MEKITRIVPTHEICTTGLLGAVCSWGGSCRHLLNRCFCYFSLISTSLLYCSLMETSLKMVRNILLPSVVCGSGQQPPKYLQVGRPISGKSGGFYCHCGQVAGGSHTLLFFLGHLVQRCKGSISSCFMSVQQGKSGTNLSGSGQRQVNLFFDLCLPLAISWTVNLMRAMVENAPTNRACIGCTLLSRCVQAGRCSAG